MTEVLTPNTVENTLVDGEVSAALQHELAAFLFHSFYFSQGHLSSHKLIAQFGHEYYADQLVGLSDEDIVKIKRLSADKIIRWGSNGPHRNVGFVAEELIDRPILCEPLGLILENQPPTTEAEDKLVGELIDADWGYIVHQQGRWHRNPDKGGIYNDPFLSHAIHYGLLGRGAHQPALTQMFARLQPVFTRHFQEDQSGLASAVTKVYVEHHPEDAEAVAAVLAQ